LYITLVKKVNFGRKKLLTLKLSRASDQLARGTGVGLSRGLNSRNFTDYPIRHGQCGVTWNRVAPDRPARLAFNHS
jgi:hypothetical protein